MDDGDFEVVMEDILGDFILETNFTGFEICWFLLMMCVE